MVKLTPKVFSSTFASHEFERRLAQLGGLRIEVGYVTRASDLGAALIAGT